MSMNPGDALVAIGGMTVLFGAPTLMFRSWLGYKERMAKLNSTGTPADDRLARMEQAIDAIAVEVERISEGQRFTAKLLAERGSPRLPEPVRRITPH